GAVAHFFAGFLSGRLRLLMRRLAAGPQAVEELGRTLALEAANEALEGEASLETAVDSGPQETQELALNTAQGDAQTLIRAFYLARAPVLGPRSRIELVTLVQRLVDADTFLDALDAVERLEPKLERSDVLRTLVSHSALSALRTAMGVQALGGQDAVTFDGFVEQLTSNLAYSNAVDLSDSRGPNPARDSAAKLLRAFGYKATPAIHGAWGLQMMLFTPITGQGKYTQRILAFRGTEGVKFPVAAPGRPTAPTSMRFARTTRARLILPRISLVPTSRIRSLTPTATSSPKPSPTPRKVLAQWRADTASAERWRRSPPRVIRCFNAC
ncbi:MAG: hypothetical protein HC933_15075, partial [Pleurocapsa sp. SU_196_0]|nr:hypothetical protein [Pleurocapsa sp. SU_196_0]